MYKTMAKFFNDNFTKQEEYFIQKIIQTFKGFKTSNYFHSQLQKSIESNEDGGVGKLIELIIKDEFFKQHPNYDKNLSSEPYLRFLLPKTDLEYRNNILQIKTINFNRLINSNPIKLIEQQFNTNIKKECLFDLSSITTQQEYKKFFKERITLTLFIIYDFKDNFFNFQYFFLTKNKLIELFLQNQKSKKRQITINHYNKSSIQFLKPTINKLKTIKPIKIKIDKTKTHTFKNELKFNLNLEYLKTIQQILNSQNFLKEIFNLIKKFNQNYHTGSNGELIELLFSKYLNENKYFKKLLLNQSCIKQITNIPVDYIINNNFFQLKTFNLKIDQFQFKLFENSNFPKTESFEEKINFYNSKICNTLILTYCEKEKTIIPYFLTYKNLLINKNSKNKNKNRVFNFKISKGITCCHNQNKKNQFISINITKNQQLKEQFLLSNQIKILKN